MKNKEQKITIKLFTCIIYFIILTILSICSYKLYEKENKIIPFSQVENTKEHSYIDIYKMSEKFAFYEEKNIGIHFVIEKEETGLWHTYLIAINEDYYNEFKDIIDYTYERTEKVPETIRIYGYPKIVKDDLKALAIKNIPKFVPAENEVSITNENYEKYLTNTYLDTTIAEKDNLSLPLIITILLLVIVLLVLIKTIFGKEKIKK